MALHFEPAEYEARKKSVIRELDARGLDGLLMFQQESMYYLTGFDTFGFCFFQCLYLATDGTLALLTRSADLRQAQHTSNVEDIRIWTDGVDANPPLKLRDMLESLGTKGKKLGVEYQSYGLTAANGKALDAVLDGFCTLEDASGLVDSVRVVKSPAELAFVRNAGELCDAALQAALLETRAGAAEGAILAAMQGAVFSGGGDYPANEFIIGSGEDALLCRYKAGRRILSTNDQLTLEWAGAYRHYHAAMMDTVIIGELREPHEMMFAAAQEALLACREQLRPGRTAGDVYSAHADVMAEHGLEKHALAACGYSLGAKFTPSWMDWPMFYKANPAELGPGMVFFTHMILMDSDTGTAMTLGRSYILTEGKPEHLSKMPLELLRC
ncbi:MAG: M24 family metallopeptidase [Hyphomicrobiales bacterium]